MIRVIAGAFLLIVAGLLHGALHSWLKPIQLRPVAGESTKIRLPGSSSSTGGTSEGAGDADAVEHGEGDEAAPVDAEAEGVDEPELDETEEGETLELGLEISLEQARILYEQLFPSGEAQFIDARTLSEFEQGHIVGALRLSAEMVDSGNDNLYYLVPEFPTVIYCTGGDCDASHNVAVRLQGLGFTSVHILVEGYPAWEAAGYETETGLLGSGEEGG